MATTTFLNNIDEDKVHQLISETESSIEYFVKISDQVLDAYTSDLDDIMQKIYKEVVLIEYPATDVIEKYFIELSNVIYFMSEKLERLGVYEDMSKAMMQEVFNRAYIDGQTNSLDSKTKITVAELTARAQESSKYEAVVNSIYSRSYSVFKSKINSANTMVATLSKILSKRMQEMNLSGQVERADTRRILNE